MTSLQKQCKMANATHACRPSVQDLMKDLHTLSFDKTKELVLFLGVPLESIDDITASGGMGKARCFQKWLDIDPDASWEKLVSALKYIRKNTLAVEIEETRVRGIEKCNHCNAHLSTSQPPIMDSSFEIVKIVLCGSSGVGKTSLITRYFYGCMQNIHDSTIGVDICTKSINVGGKSIKLQVWDTAGQERFRSITIAYFRGVQGVILTYDITKEMSFNMVSDWVKHIRENAPDDVVIVLVGNKIDLDNQRTVPREMGEKKARENGMQFFEASACSGEHVEEVFESLVLQITSKNTVQRRPAETVTVPYNPSNIKPAKKSQCC